MFRTFLLVGASAMALAASSAGAVTFAYTGAVQNYTIVSAGIYKLQAYGAQGGNATSYGNVAGGYGAAVGRFATIGANTSLSVVVGESGGGSNSNGGGGGGGTFIMSGSSPVLVAGGGGGAGNARDAVTGVPSPASLRTFGTNGGAYGYRGFNGYGGSAGGQGRGQGYGGSGGGAGIHSNGGTATGSYAGVGNGGGGGSAPAFQGGGGAYFNSIAGSGGFGGGGGGSAGPGAGGGGGGGGFSGGGGTSFNQGGGGGGSFGNDSTFIAVANHSGNGSASIDAIRLFAAPTLSTHTLDFGVVRGGFTAQQQGVTITNTVIADPASDKLVTVLGSLPATVTSSAASASTAAGQSNTIAFSLSATPGSTSADVGLAFTSHATTGDDINLGSSTVHITGTVTDLAVAVIVGKGDGLLTFKNGHYVLDLGDVAANSGVRSTLVSMLNGVTYSAYSERLNGYYSGLSSDGFSLALRNPINIADDGQPPVLLGQTEYVEGGVQTDLGLLGFDPTGLSLGRHSRTIDFYALTTFGNFPAYGGPDAPITVEANVTAGVPVAGVPEPATWGLLTAGFGMIGAAMRRRQPRLA